jgi:hypothetical protein
MQDPAQLTLLINMLSWVDNVESSFAQLDTKPDSLDIAYKKQV